MTIYIKISSPISDPSVQLIKFNYTTRMHSSRMHTAHSLTVSRLILCMPPSQLRTPPNNHACHQQPCTSPDSHASPAATAHTPQQPCTPPATMHAPQQPCMPPGNYTPLATTHAPWQPLTPPNHAHPRATTHVPPVNRITHTCKNITLPQLRCRQ